DDVDGRADTHAGTQAEEASVAADAGAGERVGYPERRRIYRGDVAERARDDDAERGCVVPAGVVLTLDTYDRREAGRRRGGLLKRVVLARELKRLAVVGARGDRLQVPHDAEAVLELNRRALIEAEQVAELLVERRAPQVLVEAVRQVEVAAEARQRQRRRQVDDGEIGFERP